MGIKRIILEGMKSHSVLPTLLGMSLYVIYSIFPYSSSNVPTKSLLPTYDFIIVGGGSAGMTYYDAETKLR